jgi:hypothetical protein
MRRALTLLLPTLVSLVSLVGAWACSGREPAPARPAASPPGARAFRIERAEDLLPGPGASGTVGDFRLGNERVAFIISDAPIAYGFSETGGNLMDAAPVGGRDALAQMHLYLGDDFPRQAHYAEVAVGPTEPGAASIVARGVDSKDRDVTITTVYRLEAGSDTLVLRTTVKNQGKVTLAGYGIGDVLSWGQAEHFAPGYGFNLRGKLSTPWLAGVGEDVSYGYTAASGTLDGPHGSSWSDTDVGHVDLAPDASVTIERYFVVGTRGDAAGVLARIHALRGERAVAVRGIVREDVTGDPVARARVTAWHDETEQPTAEVVAETAADGTFELPLRSGSYRLDAAGPGRNALRTAKVTVVNSGAAPAPVELEVSRPGRLGYRIFADGAPSPGKLTFRDLGSKPVDPVLGPRHRAAGAGNVLVSATGSGEIALAPGRYEVVASRGPEYDLSRSTVEILPGGDTRLHAELHHVVDTSGYVSGDFHQHQLPSPDAAVSLVDRVVANLAEGVELAVATDHNQITDLADAARSLGATAPLRTVVGLEATTENIGHFMAYPLQRYPHASRGGAPLVDGKQPGVIFRLLRALRPEIVLQVNHPRSGKSGYFDLAGFPKDAADAVPAGLDLSFDSLELLNGKRVQDFDQVLADWFQLLTRGLSVTGMGGSDSHAIVGQECGYPRVYLGVGADDPARVTDAQILDVVKHRKDVLVSNGPYFTLRARGASAIGQHFALAPGETLDVELVVQAAPWVDVKRVQIYLNGKLIETQPVATDARQVVRHRATLQLGQPGFYVVAVRGDASLAPVVPADLVPVTPIAVANPIWIEPRK